VEDVEPANAAALVTSCALELNWWLETTEKLPLACALMARVAAEGDTLSAANPPAVVLSIHTEVNVSDPLVR
jgi:hypothetical protein